MTKNELIEFVKPYLKKQGFLKKNNKWTKVQGEFTVILAIQGSLYDKNTYYIRPEILINAVHSEDCLSHFSIDIKQVNTLQVINDFEDFCRDWTNKDFIRKTLVKFMEWEERNPLEKRRAGLCDYVNDPVPSNVCFSIPIEAKNYIIENF